MKLYIIIIDDREENSPAAPAGIRTRDLSVTSPAPLTAELSPLPIACCNIYVSARTELTERSSLIVCCIVEPT